jgi:hypothetical protein
MKAKQSGVAAWMKDPVRLAAAIQKRKATYLKNHPKKNIRNGNAEVSGLKEATPRKKRKYVRHKRELVSISRKLGGKHHQNGTQDLVNIVPVFCDIIWNDFTLLEKAEGIKAVLANR